MSAETEFLNDALGQAGIGRITAIDDGSEQANWCQTFFAPLRKAMLRGHHWNFAEDRAILSILEPPPAFEFSFGYGLPADLLKIKEYNGTFLTPTTTNPFYWMRYEGRYKIEGNRLLSNESEVFIGYVKDISNPALWDPIFYQMLASVLASKLARALSKDTRKAESLYNQGMGMWLPFAAAVDGQEGTVLPYISDDLLWGR